MTIWSEEQLSLLSKWTDRINSESTEYRYYSIVYTRTYYMLGIIAVSILSIFSTTGFVAITVCPSDTPDCSAKLILEWMNVGFDLLAAIMVGLSTFLDFSGHAEKCRTRKIELDALARTIEESRAYTDTSIDTKEWIHTINKQYHEIQKKQIILGLGMLCMSRKEIVDMHPITDQPSCAFTSKEDQKESTEMLVFKETFRKKRYKEYQLDRLNESLA